MNPLVTDVVLRYFTQSNARRFYSSIEEVLGSCKGFNNTFHPQEVDVTSETHQIFQSAWSVYRSIQRNIFTYTFTSFQVLSGIFDHDYYHCFI